MYRQWTRSMHASQGKNTPAPDQDLKNFYVKVALDKESITAVSIQSSILRFLYNSNRFPYFFNYRKSQMTPNSWSNSNTTHYAMPTSAWTLASQRRKMRTMLQRCSTRLTEITIFRTWLSVLELIKRFKMAKSSLTSTTWQPLSWQNLSKTTIHWLSRSTIKIRERSRPWWHTAASIRMAMVQSTVCT